MPELQDWKAKLKSIYEALSNKQVINAAGVVAFLGTAYWVFRRLHLQNSPSIQHIHHIHDNILKALETSQKSRSSLIVEDQRTLEKKGISMVFTLISKLKEKEKNTSQSIRNPFLPPFEEGLFIQDLGNTHRLLFNKFNIYQKHLLVTTRDFQAQSVPLTRQDFRQTVFAFKAIKGLYFFNSGINAGASQKHKHIQIFPEEARNLPIFRNMLEFVRQRQNKIEDLSIIEYPHFNFQHGLVVVGAAKMYSESQGSDKIDEKNEKMQEKISLLKDRSFRAFNKLYGELIQGKHKESDYNLVGCQEFLLLVPRKKEKAFDRLSVNGVGFMGSVLFKSKEEMIKYIDEERHGFQILQDITYRKQ